MNTIKKYFDSMGSCDLTAHVTIKDCDKGILYDGTCEHMPIILMKRELLSMCKLVNGDTVWYNFTLIEEPEEPEEPNIILELTRHEAIMLGWLIANGGSNALTLREQANTPLDESDYTDIIEYHFKLYKEINDKLKEGC